MAVKFPLPFLRVAGLPEGHSTGSLEGEGNLEILQDCNTVISIQAGNGCEITSAFPPRSLPTRGTFNQELGG